MDTLLKQGSKGTLREVSARSTYILPALWIFESATATSIDRAQKVWARE